MTERERLEAHIKDLADKLEIEFEVAKEIVRQHLDASFDTDKDQSTIHINTKANAKS